MVEGHRQRLRGIEPLRANRLQQAETGVSVHVEISGETTHVIDRPRGASYDAERRHLVQMKPRIVVRPEHEEDDVRIELRHEIPAHRETLA